MSAHQCRACIVYCMDFRLHDGLARFFADQGLDQERADVIRVAGAGKTLVRPGHDRDREWLLEQLTISYDLHQARQFYVINHEDCGAYGPEVIPDSEEELGVHRGDLAGARAFLRERFPDVDEQTYFMWLDGHAEHVTD